MTAVFLDTVGLIAVWERSDQWHEAAASCFAELLSAGRLLVTTHEVLLECGNALARRPYRADLVQLRQELIEAGGLVKTTPEDEQAAWEAFARGEAGQAGIVDQLSFLVMRRLGLTEAFTNDAHFRAAGFQTLF